MPYVNSSDVPLQEFFDRIEGKILIIASFLFRMNKKGYKSDLKLRHYQAEKILEQELCSVITKRPYAIPK